MRHVPRVIVVAIVLLLASLRPAMAQNPTTTGPLATTGDTVVIPLVNVPSAAVQLTGTWAGTAVFEATVDNGVTWQPITVFHMASGAPVFQVITDGLVVLQNAGYTAARVRAATWGSGTATVTATRGFVSQISSPCNLLLRAAGACK